MNKRTLIITSPIKGGIPHQYFQSFLYLASQGIPGWRFDIACEGNQNALNLSRNIIADNAIKSGCDDTDLVLMLDTDHKWDIDMLKRMVAHDYSKYHVISGAYCKKEPGQPQWLGLVKRGVTKPLENGLIECEFLPTGFLCMSVGLLRKMAKDNPEREFYYDADGKTVRMTELFPIGVKGPRTAEARLNRIKEALKRSDATIDTIYTICYDEQEPGRCVGEDYCFSFLATKSGYTLWIDTTMIVPHVGPCEFPITADMVANDVPIPQNASDTQQW